MHTLFLSFPTAATKNPQPPDPHHSVQPLLQRASPVLPPDDDDDAVEAVVGVLDVAEEAQRQQLEQHLQAEQAGEHHVADLQNIRQLLRLQGEESRIDLEDVADEVHRK